MNSLLDMMKRNRGVRNYSDQPVSRTSLLKILEAGAAAPSGIVNGVHIYVVDAPDKRKQIHSICVETEREWLKTQPQSVQRGIKNAPGFDPELLFLRKAPLLLVVSTRPQDPEIPYAVEAAFMALGYMMVMIKGIGLIASPFAPSVLHEKDADRLNSILEMPDGEAIQALLPIGYPLKTESASRRPFGKNVFHNRYGEKFFS